MRLTVPTPVITVMAKQQHTFFAGLQVTYRDLAQIDGLFHSLEAQARQAAAADGMDLDASGLFMVGVIMPCGGRFLFYRAADIPRQSLPCTCGDPRHWVVRYAKSEEPAVPAPSPVWP